MLWIICNHFKMLPNNPALKALSWAQKVWVLANIEFDLRQEAEIFGRKGAKEGVMEKEYGLDDDEFKELSKKMRDLAEEQHQNRLKEKANGQ